MKRVQALRAGVVTVASLGALAAPAQASDATIKAIIKSAGPRIATDELKIASTLRTFRQTGNPAPVQLAITSEIGDLRRLSFAIAGQTASSPKVRAGKTKFVNGLHTVERAYGHLAKGLGETRVAPATAKREATVALKELASARKQLKSAEKLLG